MNMKVRFTDIHWWQIALSSLAFAGFYVLALPLQTYLSNANMFAYGAGELLLELVRYFLVLFIGSFVIGVVTAPIFGRVFPLICIIAAICGYLEVGILSLGMPPLNGDTWWFNRATMRKYLDIFVFIMLLGGGLVFCKKLFGVLHWIALAFIVMSAAFIFDVSGGKEEKVKPSAFAGGFCSLNDMVKSVEFSTNRNVIIISLDSAPADLADEIMMADEKLRSRFPGFVAYSQNIGMHDCTTKGAPPLVTGRYVEKEDTERENNASFWGEKSILNKYKDAGYDMYVRMAVGPSYTNKRKVFTPKAKMPSRKNVLDRYSKTSPYLTMKDVLVFRMIPYRYKLQTLKSAMAAGSRHAFTGGVDMGREWNLYPALKEAGVVADKQAKCFCLFHTEGVHVPIWKGRDGKDLTKNDDSREGIKNYLHYLLESVADLCESFREKGIYDRSMIILTTDHGIVKEPKSALLWVKPFAAVAPYTVDKAPTSHAKIAALLSEAVDGEPTCEQVTKMLSMKERKLRIRAVSPEKWWQFGRLVDTYDFIYDEDGNEISRECLGEFVLP